MPTLEQKRKERDEAFDHFTRTSKRAYKNTVAATKWRNLYQLANEEVRAMERELLATPII
jgi:hypothetical protein